MASGTLTKDVILNLEIKDSEVVNNIAALSKKLDELKFKRQNLSATIKQAVKDEQEANGQVYTKQQEQARYNELYYEALAKLDVEIKETKRSLGAYQKELQNNLVVENAEKNSLDAMRAQLLNLRKAYESLSEVERESDDGQKKQKEIADLTQKIKDLEAAQLDFRKNVGNYPEIGNAKQALKEMTAECVNLTIALEQSKGKIQAQNTELQMLASTLGTDSQEYKDAAAELQRMNEEYATSTQKLDEMIQEAGKMKDTIGDVNQRINSFANDQQKIAAAQEGMSVLTSAYTILEGSLAALGVKSKSLLEIYARMQIVQQSLNSVMTIYKALNKDSNLMIVARQKLEQARLVWTKAYNAALKEQNGELVKNTAAEGANTASTTILTASEVTATGATFSLKAAFEALKVTLLSNPFTAVALAVTAAAVAIGKAVKKIVKGNKEAAESTKKLKEEEEKLTEEMTEGIKERTRAMSSETRQYDEQVVRIKTLLAVVRSEVAGYNEKKKALNELNRIVPEYNGKLSETGQLIAENTAAIDDYIAKLEAKARAEGYAALLVEEYKKEADIQKQLLQLYDERQQYADVKIAWEDPTGSWEKPNWDEYQKAEENLQRLGKIEAELNSQLVTQQNNIKTLTDMAIGYGAAMSLVTSNKTNGSEDKDNDKETEAAKAAQDTYNEMLKIANDYYKELDKMATDSVQTLTEKENLRYKGERGQLQQALVDAQKLYEQLSKDPKLLKELQKKNKYLSLETLQKQIEILGTELENVEERHNQNLNKITTDTETAFNNVMKKLQLDLDLASADETTRLKAQLQKRLDALDAELEKELAAHEYTEQQKLEITKKYEEKKKQAIADFSSQSQSRSNEGDYSNMNNVKQIKAQLAADIAALEARKEAELAVFKGTEAEKAAIVKKYADQRVQYEKNASKQEAKIWMKSTMIIADALATSMGNMSDLFNTLAEDDEKMNKYAKELAMGQIILSAAVATAQAVVAAINAGKDTGLGAAIAIPLFVVEFLGIVAGVIAQAKATLKQANSSKPKFAEGGLVGTRTTTKKDDKVDAKLSEGEYVIKSEVVSKLGVPFFDFLNYGRKVTHSSKSAYAEGGVVSSNIPQSVIQQTQSQFNMEDFKDAITDAISEMPNPEVSVKEITTVQKRVKAKERLSKAK